MHRLPRKGRCHCRFYYSFIEALINLEVDMSDSIDFDRLTTWELAMFSICFSFSTAFRVPFTVAILCFFWLMFPHRSDCCIAKSSGDLIQTGWTKVEPNVNCTFSHEKLLTKTNLIQITVDPLKSLPSSALVVVLDLSRPFSRAGTDIEKTPSRNFADILFGCS